MKISFFLFTLLLFACVKSEQTAIPKTDCFNHVVVSDHKLQPVFCKDTKDWRYYENDNVSLTVPGSLFFNHTDDRTIFYTKYDNRPEQSADYNVEMTEFFPQSQSPTPQSTSCSPTTLGVSIPSDISKDDIKILKGRVDYFDGGKDIYSMEPRPLCIPPSLNGLSDEEIGIYAKTRAAYAFCSEKDDKTVVICISQMTKNEELATKIFDSFKWTK